ncbi:ATP-NAD kinase family protein [Shewanella avicenniae]|uniref:ATP-NAD kinase family protein n=1 Tax=Shewanella avicenniae TaxID=2814294 RepID=A0ABX7QVZ5_9GAMM|nr:ATP-NAD kinase family protein [Shewanella avicenniae]QSX35434.1 ATP-NAD kinase family protein [Shewanella avicenniae]
MNSETQKFRLGLIINPFAGLGGSVALKGSDGVAAEALARGAEPKAPSRASQALQALQHYADKLVVYTAAGELGERVAVELGFDTRVLYAADTEFSTAEDTQAAVRAFAEQTLDLLVFVGGDGTARDVFSVVAETQPVLGVPAGVKIHSGVYAITPHAAGKVLDMLLKGELVRLMQADVMDIDEAAFRGGTVKARRFGEMLVPAEPRYIQAVKMGGREVDELVLADIAADVIDTMEDELYIIGSGSTVAAIMDELGLANTLLGVDLVEDRKLIGRDLTSSELLEATSGKPAKLVITLIGGQGHILGRGNQQLSPALIRQLGKDNIIIVATKTKLKALEGRPLIVDSGDPELDAEMSGYYRIVTGYRDYVMYRVANPDLAE